MAALLDHGSARNTRQGLRSEELPENSLLTTEDWTRLTPEVDFEVPRLENWAVQANGYSTEVATKVGVLGRLFGGDVKRVRAGVMHEAKRFTVRKTGDDTEFIIGVAVRIFAATTEWKANLQLTLPNLAADAQLNTSDARIGVEVVGYTGPLGTLLPSPQQLNVESFAVYLRAFNSIQEAVFGEAGLPFLAPRLLSFDDKQLSNSG